MATMRGIWVGLLAVIAVAAPAVVAEEGSAGANARARANAVAGLSKNKPEPFGWIEEVMLDPGRRWKLDAKLDTGADTSSLDARNVRRVRVGKKKFVRFDVVDPVTGDVVSLRRPYVRTVKIRRHSGNHEKRQVVLMTVCMGDKVRTIEVTLADRVHFNYPLLLGRSALSGLAVVDPRATRTREPTCWAGRAVGPGAKPVVRPEPVDGDDFEDDISEDQDDPLRAPAPTQEEQI